MWAFWLMAAVGFMLALGGVTKATWIPYRWLHARAALLWKQRAHTFLVVSGIVIALLGVLAALGVIWK